MKETHPATTPEESKNFLTGKADFIKKARTHLEIIELSIGRYKKAILNSDNDKLQYPKQFGSTVEAIRFSKVATVEEMASIWKSFYYFSKLYHKNYQNKDKPSAMKAVFYRQFCREAIDEFESKFIKEILR